MESKKETRWVCLGCFNVTKEKPEDVCCENRFGEPMAVEKITDYESSPWAGVKGDR